MQGGGITHPSACRLQGTVHDTYSSYCIAVFLVGAKFRYEPVIGKYLCLFFHFHILGYICA